MAVQALAEDVSVGAQARACMEVDGVVDHHSAGVCFGQETQAWEARIAMAMDALAQVPPGASGAADLDAVAGAFEAHRAATCEAAGVLWPGMSGSGEAWAECRMALTAAHALRLEHWLEVLE
ncbi:MAG: hypothetical protein Gyms2KO_40150 [Gymnodinialimonas sp.]